MNYTPLNAAPMTISLGVNDRSSRPEILEPPALPIHYPLCFIWAADGPTEPISVTGSMARRIYGAETFDLRSKFANHSTVFTNMFLNNANTCMVKRVRPTDAPPPANIRIYADVLTSDRDEYERDPVDGQIKQDTLGGPKTTGQQIKVTEIKFVAEYIAPENANDEINTNFGKGTKVAGTLSNSGETSEKIPLFDFEVPFFGSMGNLRGIKLWSPTNSVTLNTGLINQKVFPFFISFMKKASESATPRPIPTNFAELQTEFVLKPGFIDEKTNASKYMGDVVIDNYRNLNSEVPDYGPFGKLHIYQDNIDNILKEILKKEKDAEYAGNELKDLTDDIYLINLFGATNSTGLPYQTFRLSSSTTGGVRLNESTTINAQGGGDGTMTEDAFGDEVISVVREFNNPNSPWQDFVSAPCSFLWDSGFSAKVKKELGNFIALRKNTVVVLGTHTAGKQPLTAAEESSMGAGLVTHLRSFPESEYFGTKTYRGFAVSRSGKIHNAEWRDHLPVTYSLANKISRFAGAADGKFKMSQLFDRPPANLIDDMYDINVPWTPAAVRNKDWAAGLMYVEKISQRQFYFSHTRTVYDDDTSVLNSILTALVCIRCQTVGLYAQKYFSGGNRTKGELKRGVEAWVREQLVGRFGEMFIITPEVTFSEADDRRGYSWTLTIRIGAGNMRTVQTLVLETYRKDEFPETEGSILA